VFFLSPAKLLVIFVVVMIVVGPDRLPNVARQIGAALQSLRQLTSKVEGDLRDSIPNLPSSREIAHYTRKPTALLSKLMDMSGEEAAGGDAEVDEHLVADPGAEAVIDTGPPLPGADWPTDHAAPASVPEAPSEPSPLSETTPMPLPTTNGARHVAASTGDGTPYSDPNMN
jgi:Sec-independent protein translocase protein TatA